ncbi:MAG: outer membrane lipoprotein carrier protein LolA [Verrucomicrobiales bacterium]
MRGLLFLLLFLSAGTETLIRAETPDLNPVRQWIGRASKITSVEAVFIQERVLKTLNRPLTSPGRMWFKAPGSLRWQIGEPAKLIVIQAKKGAPLYVLDPSTKVARIFVAAATSSRASQVLSFLEAGFPRSLDEFQQRFRIQSVERKESAIVVSGQLNDRRSAVAVMKVVFIIEPASYQLRQIEVWFRDGSKIINKMTQVIENAAVPTSVFDVGLEGYRIDQGD